jgi:hypothetical protein
MKTKTTVVAALAAVLLAGCSSSTGSSAVHGASGNPATPTSTTVAQPAAHGVEAAIGAVPWSQIGPGWLLATWSPIAGHRPGVQPPPGEPAPGTASTTLYLVDPAGGRYPIISFPPTGDKAGPELVDWSGDGSHALFYAPYAHPPTATMVDLRTGAQTMLPVDALPRFTRPDGKALLLSTSPRPGSRLATLERVDLAGNHHLTYPTDKLGSDFNGGYLSTPDGARLVLGTSTGLVLMGNDETVGATLSIPGQTDCRPLRWWDGKPSTTVLASCDGPGSMSRLWLVPIDGGTPTALTAPNNHQKGPDLGDGLAWQVPAGTFIQAAGACGVIYLAKLNPDGTTSEVSVPETQGSVRVIGVSGADLQVQARAACGGGQALLDYDPAANTSTVLLGGPLNGGGVIDAVPYASQK